LLAEKSALLLKQKQIIERKSDVISEQKKRIAILEEALRLSKIKRFAPTSEQSNQGSLFDEAEVEQLKNEEEETTEDQVNRSDKKAKTGRKPFAKNLPREQVFIDLTDEEKEGAIDTFYTKVKEELDIIPAQVRVLEYMQEKAVFIEQDGRKIKSALMPKSIINRAMGSIGLMCFIIVAKYADGLPLYRLENILARYGGQVTRSTMANWMIALASQLQPLINLLREHQNSSHLIQIDETRIKVLKEPDRAPTSHKYMWVTLGGPEKRFI